MEPVGTSLVVSQTVYLKLFENDYNVPAVSLKCQEQLDSEEAMVITDSKGQELLDTSGTQGGHLLNLKKYSNYTILVPRWGERLTYFDQCRYFTC